MSFSFFVLKLRVFLLEKHIIIEFLTSDLLDLVHSLENFLFGSWFILLKLGQAKIALNIVLEKRVGFELIDAFVEIYSLLVLLLSVRELLQRIERRPKKVKRLNDNEGIDFFSDILQ